MRTLTPTQIDRLISQDDRMLPDLMPVQRQATHVYVAMAEADLPAALFERWRRTRGSIYPNQETAERVACQMMAESYARGVLIEKQNRRIGKLRQANRTLRAELARRKRPDAANDQTAIDRLNKRRQRAGLSKL